MSYDYATQRPHLFTDDGQRLFLRVRDRAQKLLAEAGAARMQEIISGAGSADVWHVLACVDRMVELREIVELNYGPCAGQHRVFVSAAHG